MPLSMHDRLRQQVPEIRVTKFLIAANLLVFVAMLFSGAGLWHSQNGVQLAWGRISGRQRRMASGGGWGARCSCISACCIWASTCGRCGTAGSGWSACSATRASWRSTSARAWPGNLASIVFRRARGVGRGFGAIFGVYGALLAPVAAPARIHRQEFRWLFGAVLVFSALTIAFGLAVPGIDNAAHMGGLAAGLLLGLALVPRPGGAARRAATVDAAGRGGRGPAVLPLPRPDTTGRTAGGPARDRDFLREDAAIIANWKPPAGSQGAQRPELRQLASPHRAGRERPLPAQLRGTLRTAGRPACRRRRPSSSSGVCGTPARCVAGDGGGLRERDPRKIGEALREAREAGRKRE